ncbi:suppressor of cytokine signaling 2-like [Limulus polyphemus]|uniref:Suppressor of cytokine signaling 2-like n=1 Tax=Limulus polyphemus TaxID=6850 RepID=A0ABM1STQ9_LIMPO|nr:suppressor of cytokine signaling 2-like [Limulus polyphemus]XP_022247015.1 suppressor of cytokine signaling 2-like [Limulus polyphemus]
MLTRLSVPDSFAQNTLPVPGLFIVPFPGAELTVQVVSSKESASFIEVERPELKNSPKHSPSVNGFQSPTVPYPTTPTADMDFCLNADFQRINRTVQKLRTSGYYYESLSQQQASVLLQNKSVGTFILRDSSDPRFLFSLSVQTERGPTSVRIHYIDGQFRLDSEESITMFMPLFDCVVQLVEYYVRLSQSAKGSSCVWLDGTGRRDVPIRLYQPLYKKVLPLQHQCRLAINKQLQAGVNPMLSSNVGITDQNVNSLKLPNTVKAYLRDYPYGH